MTGDVQHTTTTLASADPTPSTVTTHPQTESWVYTVIAVMGVVLVVLSLAIVAVALLLLKLRRLTTCHKGS